MTAKFPRYAGHEDASCWNCGGDLMGDYWRDDGYPPGRGQYSQNCRKCSFNTHYDLEKKDHERTP